MRQIPWACCLALLLSCGCSDSTSKPIPTNETPTAVKESPKSAEALGELRDELHALRGDLQALRGDVRALQEKLSEVRKPAAGTPEKQLPAERSPTAPTAATKLADAGEQVVALRPIQGIMGSLVQYYGPQRLVVSEKRPEGLKAEPKYKSPKPLYGQLVLGDGPDNHVTVVLDEPENETPRIYVDRNHDQDLTNDGDGQWTDVNDAMMSLSHVAIDAPYKTGTVPYTLEFYRFKGRLHEFVLYYRNACREGEINSDGKAYKIAVLNENADGRFDNLENGTLLIDLNRDGKLEGRPDSAEFHKLSEPFNIHGRVWEVASMTPDGLKMVLRPSKAKVEMKAYLDPGCPAPPFAATGLDGNPIDLRQAAADSKLVLLDFWASWCGPCRGEFPSMKRLHERYQGHGLRIVGVNLDDDRDKAQAAAKEAGLDYPHAFDGQGWQNAAAVLYRVHGIPQTYLLDKDLKILAVSLRGEDLENRVRELLGPGDNSPADVAPPKAEAVVSDVKLDPTARFRVGYVFGDGEKAAASFKKLLDDQDLQTDLIAWAGATNQDFAPYSLIVVASDVHGGQDGTAHKIDDAGKPILALGEGGYDCFGSLKLPIGAPHGWHGGNTAVVPMTPSESSFWKPLKLDLPKDRARDVYRNSGHVGIHVPSPLSGVALLGREAGDQTHYVLLYQAPRYVFWGFTAAPDEMTEWGSRLFVHTCRYAAALNSSASEQHTLPSSPVPPAPDAAGKPTSKKAETLPAEKKEQLRYAAELNHRVSGLWKAGRSREALPLAQEALDIRRRILGTVHEDTAESFFNLGAQYEALGEYAKAEPLYLQAIEIQRIVLGENHPDYVASLIHLAGLYQAQGDYARAEPLLRRALEIRKKVLGENHPDYAASRDALGYLYWVQCDYVRAEPLMRQALEIDKKVLGENHPDYAASLNGLGMLYKAQGDYARAEPLLRRASEIWKKVLGENHPDYAASLNNLAMLYQPQGDYRRAEPLLRQASEIWKKVLGENHLFYAYSLDNLALLYDCQGDYSRAEPLFREALGIKKTLVGQNHPIYAYTLNCLAVLCQHRGDYLAAEPLFNKALEIRKMALGDSHPDYAVSLNNLACLRQDQGDCARAEPLFHQAVTIVRTKIEATAIIQSERQQLAMLQDNRKHLDSYLSLAVASGQCSESAYRELLAWKGMVRRRNRLARAATQSPELAATFTRLQRVATQLAHLAWAAPDVRQEANWRERVAKLSAEKEQLEADLSARSAEYRQAQRAISLEDLRGALSKDSVLLDFVEYGHYMPADKKSGTKATSERRLLGFVVAPDRPLEMVPLGATQTIDEAIETWRATFGMSAEGARAAKLLRERLWTPLEEKLHGAKIVLISPDGALSRLPFGALPGKTRGTYLIEEHAFAVVPVPQLIPQLVQEARHKQLRKKLLLLGNVDYDASAEGRIGSQPVSKDSEDLSPSSRSVFPATMHFGPLPGTETEIAAIEELYRQEVGADGLTTLRKSQAGKEAFLSAARQHGYLHLATHGFFIEEKVRVPTLDSHEGQRTLALGHQATMVGPTHSGSREASQFGDMSHTPETGAAYPALLSGLALAGANRAAEQQSSPPDPLPRTGEGSDGILTAEEIGTQNLDGVQLVVLSACESGLGQQAAGEGLLGLQRSFQSAGARNVVASLWPVDDQATSALMTVFYTKLWKDNKPPLEALRDAQLFIYRHPDEIGKLAHGLGKPGKLPDGGAVKPGGKTASPEKWATFVLAGVGN